MTKKPLKVHKFLVAHANLKILRKVKKNLRGRTTARPHILETLLVLFKLHAFNLIFYQKTHIVFFDWPFVLFNLHFFVLNSLKLQVKHLCEVVKWLELTEKIPLVAGEPIRSLNTKV